MRRDVMLFFSGVAVGMAIFVWPWAAAHHEAREANRLLEESMQTVDELTAKNLKSWPIPEALEPALQPAK